MMTTFDQVYREHYNGVTRYLRRVCDHRVELDDAVQQTFMQAFTLWSRRTSDNVRAWLIGIARRVYWDMLKAHNRKAHSRQVDFDLVQHDRPVVATQEFIVMINQLREKFGNLGPAQAEALDGISRGHTADEVAQMTGKTPANVRMALSLGRKRLREMTA